MNYLFEGCYSLKSLPDISRWNTSKVRKMKNMFNGCSSLNSIPDISKWKINYEIDIDGLFYGCNSLSTFPDISKWKIRENFENSFWEKDIIDSNQSSSMSNIYNSSYSIEELSKISSSCIENNNTNNNNYIFCEYSPFDKDENKELNKYYDNFYN